MTGGEPRSAKPSPIASFTCSRSTRRIFPTPSRRARFSVRRFARTVRLGGRTHLSRRVASRADLRIAIQHAYADSQSVLVRLGRPSRRLRERLSGEAGSACDFKRPAPDAGCNVNRACALLAALLMGAAPPRFSIDAMQRVADLSLAAITPDGSQIAFCLSRVDMEHNRYDDSLEILTGARAGCGGSGPVIARSMRSRGRRMHAP